MLTDYHSISKKCIDEVTLKNMDGKRNKNITRPIMYTIVSRPNPKHMLLIYISDLMLIYIYDKHEYSHNH